MHGKINALDFQDGCKKYTLICNASHVEIQDNKGLTVFKRGPEQDEWYDPKHRKLVDALGVLEKLIVSTKT